MLPLDPRYNQWADLRLVAHLRDLPRPPKVETVLAHMAAGETWLARMEGIEPPREIWPDLPFEEAVRRLSAVDERLLVPRDGEARATYRNSTGVEFEDAFGDIVAHLLNHATYHRGEIAGLLLAQGREPPPLDLVVFRRERR